MIVQGDPSCVVLGNSGSGGSDSTGDGPIEYVRVKEFDEATVKALSSAVGAAIAKQQPYLPIYIESYGGSVYHLLAMIGNIKKAPIEVHTIVSGVAMSAGAMLFCMGDRRFLAEDGYLMFHDVSTINYGTVTRVTRDAEHTKELGDHVRCIIEKKLKKRRGFFSRMIRDANDADVYLNSQQALETGIATDIDVPIYGAAKKLVFNMTTMNEVAERRAKRSSRKAKKATKATKKTTKRKAKAKA